MGSYKMFGFIKKVIIATMTFLSCNASECVSMTNEECKIRPQVVNINSDNPFAYPYSIQVNRSSGNCNNINDPYSTFCVSNVAKNIDVKLFNLVSRTNETRQIEWHETCKCKSRLDDSL